MTTQPRRLRPLTLTLTALGLAGVIAALWLFDGQRKQAVAQALLQTGEADPVPVVVAALRREVMPSRVDSIGTVVADNQVLVASEVAGRITSIHFNSGQQIAAGTPLLQLNDAPLRRELERHRIALGLAKTNLERAQRLHGQTMSSAEYERHVAAYDDARATVAQTQEDIAQRLVRAPFGGELGLRQVNLGQYVEAGTPIVTLTDLNVLHVDFTVPERHRSALRTGLPVKANGDGEQAKAFVGKVTAIDPQADKNNHAIRVRATLDKGAQGNLWPGKFAHVSLELTPGPAVVTLPTVALESSLTGDRVYVVRQVDGKDRATLVSVRTGAQHAGRTELANDSLKEGDLVVVAGQINLQDGVLVAPRTGETNAATAQIAGPLAGNQE